MDVSPLLIGGVLNGVGNHERILDLGLRIETGMTGASGDAAAKPSKKVSSAQKMCGLFPVLHSSHDIIRVWKKVVGHCVGYNYWKMVLLVIVRNKVR